MKRKQSTRRSGRLASKSGIKQPQVKQGIRPSVSATSSSSFSVQLTKRYVANMSNHKWTKEEEKRLLELIEKDVENQHFGNAYFCRYLASEMNKIFGKNPEYIILTGQKVGNKINDLRKKGHSATPKSTSSGLLVDTSVKEKLDAAFSFRESTKSGSKGVREKKHSVPKDFKSAIDFLNEFDLSSVELVEYTSLLHKQCILEVFLSKETAAKRMKFLSELWAHYGTADAVPGQDVPGYAVPRADV